VDAGLDQDADRRLFHVGYTVEGTSKLMRRHGWSAQVPVRQAMERDEEAVAVWKAEVWPEIKGRRATWDKGLAGEETEAFFASRELGLALIRPARKTPQGFDLSNRVHPACLR
jgi:Winged helix-turn helix